MSTKSKVNYAIETKNMFKQLAERMGVEIPDNATFRDYVQAMAKKFNNPFEATNDTEMASFLKEKYFGCIVKYTGTTGTYTKGAYYRVYNNQSEYYYIKMVDDASAMTVEE